MSEKENQNLLDILVRFTSLVQPTQPYVFVNIFQDKVAGKTRTLYPYLVYQKITLSQGAGADAGGGGGSGGAGGAGGGGGSGAGGGGAGAGGGGGGSAGAGAGAGAGVVNGDDGDEETDILFDLQAYLENVQMVVVANDTSTSGPDNVLKKNFYGSEGKYKFVIMAKEKSSVKKLFRDAGGKIETKPCIWKQPKEHQHPNRLLLAMLQPEQTRRRLAEAILKRIPDEVKHFANQKSWFHTSYAPWWGKVDPILADHMNICAATVGIEEKGEHRESLPEKTVCNILQNIDLEKVIEKSKLQKITCLTIQHDMERGEVLAFEPIEQDLKDEFGYKFKYFKEPIPETGSEKDFEDKTTAENYIKFDKDNWNTAIIFTLQECFETMATKKEQERYARRLLETKYPRLENYTALLFDLLTRRKLNFWNLPGNFKKGQFDPRSELTVLIEGPLAEKKKGKHVNPKKRPKTHEENSGTDKRRRP
jgi:hypothetical protein